MMKYLELRVSVKGHARFTVFYGQSLDIETSETLVALAEFTPMRSEVPTSCTVGFGLMAGTDASTRRLYSTPFRGLRKSLIF
jgi:hypothetical protein